MPRAEIGTVDCQCCGEKASVREQKNGRAYVVCNSPVCGYQGFTRSSDADRALRAKMAPAIAAPVPDAEPKKPAELAPQPKPKKGFFDEL